MKTSFYFIPILFILSAIFSCSEDDDQGRYRIAVPEYANMTTFREQIEVNSAQATSGEDGKIYVTEQHLFYIAQESGVHIFDNSNPQNPENVAFIAIPGVHDIAIKDHFLYADNYLDLNVFDIGDLNNISLVQTLENVISFYPTDEVEAEYIDWGYDGYQYQDGDFFVGFRYEYRDQIPEMPMWLEDGSDIANFNGGQGGSFAKFQINNNALYTTDSWRINVFDISSPANTTLHNYFYPENWVGEFETMYKLKNWLFIGSTQGMAVFDAMDEFNLQYLSSFSHATGCDPVVAKDNFAYLTIRGGNVCGAVESQVNVINIEDIMNPTLESTYMLDEPYGLGIHNTTLFVGTGENGLKIFDASNPQALVLMNEINVNTHDVIPLADRLVLVGGGKVTQYNYGENYTLNEISEIQF